MPKTISALLFTLVTAGLPLFDEAWSQDFTPFGVVTVAPALVLDGEGSDVDSIAFWEAADPADTMMFVTGKANDLIEVWRYPFMDRELDAIEFPANVNGVVVDQEARILYVSDRIVSMVMLPSLEIAGNFGRGIIGAGENNLDILRHDDGRTSIYVSDDHTVHRFDGATFEHLDSFAPPVSSIETVLADDFYQVVYVPEEQGPEGEPGVYAYHPDGTPFERAGTNRFGQDGVFDSDEEGIVLYTFPADRSSDNGGGFIVVSDQRADVNEYEFFDRVTWAHLGTVRLEGITNTDGIASTQRSLPDYPLGLFAAIDDDTATALVGWDAIFDAIGWDVTPCMTPYRDWWTNRGLPTGTDGGFLDDPDRDGRSNLEEFVFDGDPLSGAHAGKRRAAIREIGGASYFTYTFPTRDDVVFEGETDGCFAYEAFSSRDLIDFGRDVVEVKPARTEGLPPLNIGWHYRTIRFAEPVSRRPHGFLSISAGFLP